MAELDLKAKITVAPKITSIRLNENDEVELEWTSSPYAEKYSVKKTTTPEAVFHHFAWVDGNSYVDNDVERNVLLWYRVVAWKRMENQKNSQKPSVAVPIVLSDIPGVKNVRVEATVDGITLEWDKMEDCIFRIYRKCEHFSKELFVGESEKNSFVDENAVSGQFYRYRVQAIKLVNGVEHQGRFTDFIDAGFLDTTEILSVKAPFGNRCYVDIKVVAGADGYILERSESKDKDFVEVAKTQDITAVSFEDKVPSMFKNYYYRACAYKNVNGEEYKGKYSAVK